MHATYWLGIEQCSNRRQNLVPDESGPRFTLTHVPEIGACRFLEGVSWVLQLLCAQCTQVS